MKWNNVCVCNICRNFFTSNKSSIHNISSSGEKGYLVWIRREICTDQALFMSKNRAKEVYTIMRVDFDVRGQQAIDFLIEWRVIMDSYFSWKQRFNVKVKLVSYTNTEPFVSQEVNWWTGPVWITCGLLWCFYQLFGLKFWRHPFTVEHPLVSKWCDAKFLQICSDEETNSPTSWIAWWWVNLE